MSIDPIDTSRLGPVKFVPNRHSRDTDELITGLNEVICWIKYKDPNATNFIYVQRAIDFIYAQHRDH